MRVSIGDVRLFFDIDGPKLVPSGAWMVERPTLLLLHPGPGFDHSVYKVQAGALLAEFAQVVYIDQRGHGRSDPSPTEELTLERWADDVRDFCDALGIERPVVLGHGFGAMVAATYGARHPDHASKLVLINPAARVVTERSVDVYRRLGGADAAAVIKRFREDPNEETFAHFLRYCFPLVSNYELTAELSVRADWRPDILMHWHRAIAPATDLTAVLGSIRAPTFVVAGEDDPEMTLEGAKDVVAALPSDVITFKSYPRARHAVFRDATQAYWDVRAFVLGEEVAA